MASGNMLYLRYWKLSLWGDQALCCALSIPIFLDIAPKILSNAMCSHGNQHWVPATDRYVPATRRNLRQTSAHWAGPLPSNDLDGSWWVKSTESLRVAIWDFRLMIEIYRSIWYSRFIKIVHSIRVSTVPTSRIIKSYKNDLWNHRAQHVCSGATWPTRVHAFIWRPHSLPSASMQNQNLHSWTFQTNSRRFLVRKTSVDFLFTPCISDRWALPGRQWSSRVVSQSIVLKLPRPPKLYPVRPPFSFRFRPI